MKINFSHYYSDLDNEHKFFIYPETADIAYFAWVFFHLGQHLLDCPHKVSIYPYKHYKDDLEVQTYKINGADKVAFLIFKKIKKIIENK